MTHVKSNTREPHRNAQWAGAAFEQYGDPLLRYLLRCRGCEQDANDLAQEVYLELLHVESPDAVRQLQAYLYRVASHVVYRFKRRRERESEFVTFDSEALDDLQDVSADATADDGAERIDVERQLEELLGQLPPLHRAIIILRKRDGMSYAQVARKLGISEHTVKKYLHRAMVQLRNTGWNSPAKEGPR